ncbi:hypothetical protein Rhal01_03346 [Rubritalea halochordaticola]|uniref:PDZ domain-containing protein n=1 Tax=Rubritalea halochordaticola TaxID=714537 RepID=A0ABP9V3B9_9BACT
MMKTFGLGAVASLSLLLSCSNLPLWAQASLPGEQRTNGYDVEAAFEPQRQVLQGSSAVFYTGRKNFLYGVVMSEDGWILTKESDIHGAQDLSVRVDKNKYTEPKIMAKDGRWDLALVKIDAEGLTPVTFAESSAIPQGSWVIGNGSSSRANRRVSIGIISAKSRKIDGAAPVVMGVQLEEVENGLKINDVTADTGAAKAGLLKGDIITKFEGDTVLKRESLIEKILDNIPGDKVEVEYLRGGQKMTTEMELMAREDAFGEQQKSRNDQMSGDVSGRRNNFPRVLQTNLPLNSRTVGGPLLDLNGMCIGMNIARANRAESYAIPLEELKEIYHKLRKEASGN